MGCGEVFQFFYGFFLLLSSSHIRWHYMRLLFSDGQNFHNLVDFPYFTFIKLLHEFPLFFRLGAESEGYEDTGVKNIRDRLSEFLCQSTSRKTGLAIQVATVTALLGVIPLNFEEIINKSNLELPALVVSHSIPPAADCISGWFSLLNKEQQSLSLSLLSDVALG